MKTAREEKKNVSGTFIVDIQYQENSTWQGKVTWADRKKEQYFRSALELIRMIDGALTEGQSDDE